MSISAKDSSIKASPLQPLAWFASLLALTAGFQIVRLAQGDPLAWLAVDYSWRVIVLALLAASPMHAAVFCREPSRISCSQLVAWLLGIGGATLIILELGEFVWRALPDLSLGQYPRTEGWIRRFDLTFDLAPVAVHEELFFRRFARIAFRRLGDGAAMIVTTSVLFGLYHWWTGLPSILITMAIGTLLMLFYRTAGALWPAIVVHYLLDLYAFA